MNFAKLKSRKLWVTIVTAAILVFGQEMNIGPDVMKWLVATVSAYLLGQGIADHGK